MIDPAGLNMILFGKFESCCDDCEFGRDRHCPHAEGRHYDIWGEGIEDPDWCWRNFDSEGNRIPKSDELPF